MKPVHELLEADRLDAVEHQHELEETRAARTHAEQEGSTAPDCSRPRRP